MVATAKQIVAFWGVDDAATRFAWISPPLMVIAGIPIAVIFAPVESISSQ